LPPDEISNRRSAAGDRSVILIAVIASVSEARVGKAKRAHHLASCGDRWAWRKRAFALPRTAGRWTVD
jgi:hypothetical protein